MPFMMLVYLLLTACDKDDVYQQDPWSGHMKSLRLQTSNF